MLSNPFSLAVQDAADPARRGNIGAKHAAPSHLTTKPGE